MIVKSFLIGKKAIKRSQATSNMEPKPMEFDMKSALPKLKIPRYEQVRLNIQDMLTSRRWDENKALPSEQELADSYQVSVGTVRKAVERLVDDGILIKHQGKGTFLKPPNFDQSLLRFFKFRPKGADNAAPIGVVKTIKTVSAIEAINQQLNLLADEELIYLERVRLMEDKVVVSEKIWLPKRLFQPFTHLTPADFDNLLYPFYYQTCGHFVASALEKLSVIKDYIDDHLDNNKEDSLVKICRIAKNLNNEPIEYRESLGMAAHFNYEITIN